MRSSVLSSSSDSIKDRSCILSGIISKGLFEGQRFNLFAVVTISLGLSHQVPLGKILYKLVEYFSMILKGPIHLLASF